jgi:hypothetical protein
MGDWSAMALSEQSVVRRYRALAQMKLRWCEPL